MNLKSVHRIPLHHAARKGHLDVVVALLEANGNETVNDQRNDGG